VWNYSYVNGALVSAVPPIGPAWSYGYTGVLSSITTPHGGTTRFTYDTQHQFVRDVGTNETCEQNDPGQCRVTSTVVTTRSIDGMSGQWTYTYS
ncbi:hypothetical protein, partial [Klebsiella pneumoniae]|uniref:hypothetical protein n=1 Tax=Klebsiella pneumoniae TaxID=573 RepID=UPI00200EF823